MKIIHSANKGRYSKIDFASFGFLIKLNCCYCGKPPSNIKTINKATIIYSGLDRLDVTEQHILGNVVPCCWECNRAKHVLSLKSFDNWVTSVDTNFFKKQSL